MTVLVKNLLKEPSLFPPIWLMRQAGRYLPEYQAIRRKLPTFMDLCFNEDLATQVTLQPIQRFDFDAAILFSDILVLPHVLGQKVSFIEGQGPVLEPKDWKVFFAQAKDTDLLEALSIPLKILKNCRRTLPSTKAVIGFSGSPWTIATYMTSQRKTKSFEKAKDTLETNNSLLLQIMALLEDAIGTFLIAQINSGADAVQIFDSWAQEVPDKYQKEWIVDPVRRLINRIRTFHPLTPIIYYGRGVSPLYPQIAKGLENIALSVDETVPISVMKDQIQKLAPVQGNLAPQILLEGGRNLEDRTRELLEAFQETPYVFNLGHGILPQTPVEHVAQLVDLVRKGK